MNSLWRQKFKIERLVREYFWSLQYEEVRTPLLVSSPGMEPHIFPLQVVSASKTFLPTSPEFAMKKLLALGMERIFQICPAFRDEPRSPEHHPEFTMLEFYETQASLDTLQMRVENLFLLLAKELHSSTTIPFRDQKIQLEKNWPRLRVVDLFLLHLGIDLRTHQSISSLKAVCDGKKLSTDISDTWDDLYFKLWLNFIEPKLPVDRPVFVTHYPISQSSLCNRVKDETGFEWANRFEVYVGALELGNAFDELRDSKVQRANFLHDQKVRRDIYGDLKVESPLDEELLGCIEKMPPTVGIAMGMDRICMLFLNAKSIDEVIPLKSYYVSANKA